MAYINVDNRIIDKLKSDDIITVLNSIIDSELEKDASLVDTQLVNECVDALLAIEEENSNKVLGLVPLMAPEKFVKTLKPHVSPWHSLNVFARAGIIAAVVAGSTMSVNAAVETVTGVNIIEQAVDTVHDKLVDLGVVKQHGIDVIYGEYDDDDDYTTETTTVIATEATEKTTEATTTMTTTTTTQPTATTKQQATTSTTTTTQKAEEATTQQTTEPTTKKETTTRKPVKPTTEKPIPSKPDNENEPAPVVFTGLSAEFDNFQTDYIYGEELSYEGMTLYAEYSDNTKKEVKLEDCSYTKNLDMNKTADYTLKVIYNDAIIRINITVRPDDETRGSEICGNDLYDYLLTDRGAYITAYCGDETSIVLSEVDGNKVVAIGSNVFKNTDLEYISADNVTKIFPEAFKDCKKLVDCFTPMAKYVGDSAFENCEKLKEAVFSDSLNHLGEGAYKNTAIEEIEIPSAIDVIPKSLCENCEKLKKVKFNGEVTTVKRLAFSGCTALGEINGAGDLVIAEDFAFYECSELTMDKKLDKLKEAGEYAFYKCNKLDIGTLPSINQIDIGSFAYCYLITEVEIPKTIKKIPYACFNGTRVEKLTLHDGIEEIGDFAFMSTMLKDVSIPKNVEKIGTRAFYTTKLRNVYFYNYDVDIDDEAFYQGSRLKLYVYDKSTALKYAQDNDINYEIMKDPNKKEGVDHYLGEYD